jgi:Flp pilus assembly protein TadD
LEPRQLAPIEGSLLDQARAVAAGEILTASAACRGDLCQLTLRRLGADRGRVLWTQTLQVSAGSALLTSDAVGAAVRRAYGERRLVRPLPALGADEGTYLRYLGLVRDLEERRRPPQEILAQLEELEQRAPEFLAASSLAASLSAELYQASGDRQLLERGLAAAGQARGLAPEDPRPQGALFDLLLAANRPEEAARVLVDLEKVAVSASDLLLRRARLAERQGDLASAELQMERLVAQRPAWQSLLSLALLEIRRGRTAEARQHLEALLERYPGQRQGMATLASLELGQGDPERALALFRDLDRRDPNLDTATNLGVALLLVRRYDEAEAAFRRASALAPMNPIVALNLADARLLLGRRAEAMDLYRQVERRVAEGEKGGGAPPPGWLSVAAQAAAHLGEGRRAVEQIQQALRASPDDPQAAFEASLTYALAGDRTSALILAEKARRGGVDARWFAFPWFDGLRSDPEFARLTRAGSSDRE